MTRGGRNWARSPSAWRREGMPAGWDGLRERILRRDGYRCTVVDQQGQRCAALADEVDHIGDRDDHGEENLRAICKPHHASKSARDASNARWAKTRARMARPQRPHPGLLPGGGE